MFREPHTIITLCAMLCASSGCLHDLDVFNLDGGHDTVSPVDAPRDRDAATVEASVDQAGPDLTTCLAPKITCSGSCIDPAIDSSNCGACGKVCSSSMTCQKGSCGCLQPLSNCGGKCVDLGTSQQHCGNCANQCSPKLTCQQGKCSCDANIAYSCSVSIALYCKASICAACPKAVFNCDGTGGCECVGKCTAGKCNSKCTPGKTNQCGSIYHACTSNGKCELCQAGYKNCDRHGGCGTPESKLCN